MMAHYSKQIAQGVLNLSIQQGAPVVPIELPKKYTELPYPNARPRHYSMEFWGNVKCCGILMAFTTRRTVSFLKCVSPSDISPFGVLNVVAHSRISPAAFFAFAEVNGISLEKYEKSSKSCKIYFSPLSLLAISKKSNCWRSLSAVPWRAGSNGLGSLFPLHAERQWMQDLTKFRTLVVSVYQK